MTNGFTLTSPAFAADSVIPARYTCDGENISPKLEWSGAPKAQSFALILEDPDAPSGTFTHWVLYDIPRDQRELPEALANVGALGTPGRNSFLRIGYGGPCPPRGSPAHRYIFTLFALDIRTLNLPDGVARRDVESAMKGHVIGQTQLIGRYGRR